LPLLFVVICCRPSRHCERSEDQSRPSQENGLLRRYAPRNDEG
jgi:hypothetical protein